MIKAVGFTIKCDLTGTILDGVYDTPEKAIQAALAAGWTKINGIYLAPSVANPVNTAISQLNAAKNVVVK
jgi:hypothetical protein